ncbi:hypothetical protein C8R46DRAFT_1356472 [Mycena filopes]|nr:hypothetical protein C8R46DRAFT_1356472 [Mycena filopes]
MPTVSLDSTLGAVEVGTLLSIFLFGIVTVQVSSYYRNFPNDPWSIKLLVVGIWTVELLHTGLTCANTYTKTITFFGTEAEQFVLSTSFNLSMILVAVIGPVVQAFYAYRIFKLAHRALIPMACWALSLVRFVNLLGIAIAAFATGNLPEFKARFSWLVISSLVLSAFTDILITGTTCYYLVQANRGQQYRKTKKMIDLMIVWTIQTGLLTSITSVLMLISFLVMNNFIWVAILFLVSRSFANSLLSTLNSRTAIREAGRATDFLGVTSASVQHRGTGAIVIEMTRSRQVDVDSDFRVK